MLIWRWQLGFLALALVLTGTVSACALFRLDDPVLDAAEVVAHFYRWYINHPGDPVLDRAYRSSTYLCKSLVDEIDETHAVWGSGDIDPFLLAPDVPQRFTVEDAKVSGDEASVLLHLYWVDNARPSSRIIGLRQVDGRWEITSISLVP